MMKCGRAVTTDSLCKYYSDDNNPETESMAVAEADRQLRTSCEQEAKLSLG